MKFEMWSNLHYIFMIVPIVLTIILHFSTRGRSYQTKRIIGIVLSSIAVLILLARNIELYGLGREGVLVEMIPLQVCHFANIVLLYAFIKDSKPMFGLAFTLNLLAAYVSILFADSLAGYGTIYTIRAQAYIWGHTLIVSITAWAFMNDFVILDTKTYIKTIKLMLGLYIGSIFLNNIIGITYKTYSNYFYSLAPEKGTPLEIFYDLGTEHIIGGFKFNIIYLIGTALFGLVSTLLLYGVAKLFKKDERLLEQ